MNTNAFQVKGDEVRIGWMIGRAPLALRGIRCADGDDGTPKPPAAQPPAAPAAPAAPVPTPPASAPAPKAPADDPLAAYRKELRDEAQAHRERAEKFEKDLAAERAAREAESKELAELKAEKAETERVGKITAAAKDLADVDALLDSTAFAAKIKDLDPADGDKLKTAITEFVAENPRFAVADPKPTPPGRQNPAPTGGGQKTAPTSLSGAIDAHYAGR